MLDVLVPEVMLQRPRVVAIIGELKTTGVAKHVWVDREWHLGSLAHALDEAVKTDGADGPAALGNEIASLDCQVYDDWCAFLGSRFHADKPCLRSNYCLTYMLILHSRKGKRLHGAHRD